MCDVSLKIINCVYAYEYFPNYRESEGLVENDHGKKNGKERRVQERKKNRKGDQ